MTRLVTRDLVFADRAPWILDFHGTFHAPAAEVWAALIDNERWPVWFEKCKRCWATSEPFGGVGSTRSIEVNGLRVDEQFIAWEPEVLWAFTATAMRMSFATSLVERVTFEPAAPGTTQILYRMALDPKWWGRPLRRLIASRAAISFERSFAALDAHLARQRGVS